MSRLHRERLFLTRVVVPGTYVAGRFVEGTTREIIAKCGIQPHKANGMNQLVTPTGYSANNAYVVRTKTVVQTIQKDGLENADVATIDNEEYVAFDVDNWARLARRTAHYEVIFIRKDKSKNGGI